MRKLILVSLFLVCAISFFAQKKYVCEFSDTTRTVLPDSIFAQMLTSARPDIEIPPDVMQQFLSQIKQKPLFMAQQRMVRAGIEKTIISIERSSRAGNLTMETFDSALYMNDELFPDSATASGFSIHPIAVPRKEFRSTANKMIILEYECNEYMSTDSTCRIWVTTDLPDYLNPGIRKGKIKGAVLGFELKENATITKCILIRFGRSL